MILDTKARAQSIGWPLLPFPDQNGELAYPPVLAESVRQQLQVILSTRPGEQLMRPGFGAGLTEFLGEPQALAFERIAWEHLERLPDYDFLEGDLDIVRRLAAGEFDLAA